MESWEGYDYSVTNPIQWAELMNLSTAEFGVGHFPRGVCALPSTLNSPAQCVNYSYVIENAGQDALEHEPAKLYGIATAAALLCVSVWAYANWGTLLRPPKLHDRDLLPRANRPTSDNETATELTSLQNHPICTDSEFKNQIFNYYYEPIKTEVELAEKGAGDDVDVEDIEAVTDLVRKMYWYDSQLYGRQSTRNYANEQPELMAKSDEILGVIRNRVLNEWPKDRNGWAHEEFNSISDLRNFLENGLLSRRYPDA
ncbi:hypothetical protein EKO27_g5481 [Xylaria grammica]|uniref:Uncharacterized protein n=1 Tax=Xylaria grammica TaxID=363999 RepID=A0A439D5C9_9PEZI|nr:hypothetical protein EKO27_g5481 [Xylaria grammica]